MAVNYSSRIDDDLHSHFFCHHIVRQQMEPASQVDGPAAGAGSPWPGGLDTALRAEHLQ